MKRKKEKEIVAVWGNMENWKIMEVWELQRKQNTKTICPVSQGYKKRGGNGDGLPFITVLGF